MAAAPPPDPRFADFFAEHHVLTLAVAKGNVPWCATCYYAWLEDRRRFVIASDPETRHMRDAFAVAHPQVAWAIALETKAVGMIRGVQCAGALVELKGPAHAKAKAAYLERFPIARMMPRLRLWGLDPDVMKLTDNRLGFGTKLTWLSREDGF
ncbi:MAG: pyridoxamine 5'-phosphate oxidase family protein [Holophagaceae bacterium]|nr:pyridoxamine 5'-phosphate oxidase family protein [Holophagaceae bacterium]